MHNTFATHIINLVIKDGFSKVHFLKQILEILNRYIKDGAVARYILIRFCSVFDRLKDLKKYLVENNGNQSYIAKSEMAITALEPFIRVLNISQTDGCTWRRVFTEYEAAINEVKDKGFHGLAIIAEARKEMLINDVVALDLFVQNKRELSEDEENNLRNWLNTFGNMEFDQLIADRDFNGEHATVPRRLELFVNNKITKIAVSEAAVERCFSLHKLVHSALRSSLSNELVIDILFIRYNYLWYYGDIFDSKDRKITEEEEDELCRLNNIDNDDER